MELGSGRWQSWVRISLLIAGLGIVFATAASSRDGVRRRTTVLRTSPKTVARAQADGMRQRWLAHRAHWPAFLTDARLHNAHVQSQGVLTSRRARAARAAKAAGGAGAAPDTVDLLLVRVGFRANRDPALTSMDASGDFRLTADSTAVVDPPPHDAAYFDAQLIALRDYYRVVSHGQVEVRGHVFPPVGEPSVKLSDAADYGPGAGNNWTIELLVKWFKDAVSAADTAVAGRIDLRDMESICLVHPGSDLQSDINGDSPNDLPSFFVTLADSVAVMGGTHEIRNGLVVPEQASQDGFVGGISGVLCHEVGHQLGLPDWYDTNIGLPAVGEWDLMDSGSGLVFGFQEEGASEPTIAFGLLPGGLSAMSRVLLGWEEPYALRAPDDSVTLRPSLTSQGTGPRIARLDVSADEYYLVENRRDFLDVRPDDVEACPYLNRDSTGVILWMSRDEPRKPPRDRRNSGEYDFFITSPSAPEEQFGSCGDLGFGLLVWKVDERVIADGFAFNEVNTDDRRRGLRLVEADGDYEIGDWRTPTNGFSGDGWNDPFREGFATRMNATSRPNNWNTDWAHTGLEITNVRFAAPESHTLTIHVADGTRDWPRQLRTAADSLPPLDPQGACMAQIGGLGTVLVVADSAGVSAFDAALAHRVVRTPVQPASLAYHPHLAPGDLGGTIAAVDSERVWLWDAQIAGDSLPVRAGFPVTVPGGCGARLVLLDSQTAGTAGALVETAGGAWVRLDAVGVGETYDIDSGHEPAVVGPVAANGALGVGLVGRNRVVVQAFGGASRSIEHGLDAPDSVLLVASGHLRSAAGAAQIVILRPDGRLRVADADQGLWSDFGDLPPDHYLGLALADVNGDGELDIVATSATRLAGLTSRGAHLARTPLVIRDAYPLLNPIRIVTPPVIADVAGDSLPEICFGTDLGLVYAFDAGGRVVSGYPRKMLPDLFPSTLRAEDVNGDGTPEILAVSSISAGATDPAGGSARPGWAGLGGTAARTNFTAKPAAIGAGARVLAAERPFIVYPNPARGAGTEVRLRMTTPHDGAFQVAIYTLEGQRVFEQSGALAAGTKEIAWRPGALASGVYLCRFVSAAAGVASPLVTPITLVR